MQERKMIEYENEVEACIPLENEDGVEAVDVCTIPFEDMKEKGVVIIDEDGVESEEKPAEAVEYLVDRGDIPREETRKGIEHINKSFRASVEKHDELFGKLIDIVEAGKKSETKVEDKGVLPEYQKK